MTNRSKPNNLMSKRAEQALIKAGQRLLLNGGYPNPERVACPEDKVLKAIAFRKMPLKDALDYIDHMGYCSPCFVEYTAFRQQVVRRKRVEYAFALAALVIAMVVAGWLWKGHRFPGFGGRPNVATIIPVRLDLRNWMVFRGEQPPSAHSGPIQLPRGRLDLTVLLPLGSEAGNYGVLIGTESGKLLLEAKGPAVIRKDGVTVLRVKLDTSNLKAGAYVLGIGEVGWEPYTYPLEIR